MTKYCPVLGCEVYCKDNWIKNKASETFEANFWIIGDDIIYSRPKGFCDAEGVQNSLKLNDEIAAFISSGTKPFIQIEDYSYLKGSTLKSRKLFIDNMNSNKLRRTIIFCNANLPIKVAIKIGNQFNITDREIFISNSYSEAVSKVKELSYSEINKAEPEVVNILKSLDTVQQTFEPVEILYNQNWQIKTEGYSNNCLVINKDILHSRSFGDLRESHISLIDQMREKCQSELIEAHSSSIKYIVVDTKKIKSASRRSRLAFMKSLKKWAEKHPIEMYIMYNTNTFLGTALNLAKPLFPFQIKLANDFKEALQLIKENKGKSKKSKKTIQEKKNYTITNSDVEKLLALIGDLNWEFNEFQVPDYDFAQDHPFYYISQSISLIKEELDNLLIQRRELEDRLHQSQKMESIGRLAGGIAHDFNNILSMIIGSAELGLLDLPENHSAYENFDVIKSAGLRGAAIVKQLLNFSRKAVPEIKPVNAIGTLNDTIDFIRPTIPATIEIMTDLRGENININADPVQFQQIIMNIIGNATQAIENDIGRIIIKSNPIALEAKHVQFHPDLQEGPYYKIDIADNGPGIDQAIIKNIFDPYFTTKEIGKGSGMGLAVVHGIIKNHKGSITVDSVLGAGTKFTILLPQTIERSTSLPSSTEEIIGGNEKVMIIDDEKEVLDMEYGILTRLGYTVEKHVDPIMALQSFKAYPEKFDLVITDMAMPKMSGETLSKEMLKINSNIPIIMCTGHYSMINGQKAKDIGIAAFTEKPVPLKKLDRLIRQVLEVN